jgi:hypothetical protein
MLLPVLLGALVGAVVVLAGEDGTDTPRSSAAGAPAFTRQPPSQTRPTPVRSLNNPIVKALLEGVSEIGSPGTPGSIAVWGDNATPVVTGRLVNARAPVVAAGTLGKGRFVAFAHTDYVKPAEWDKPEHGTNHKADTRQLVANAVRWASGLGPDAVPRVGLVALDTRGFDLQTPVKLIGLNADNWLDRADEVDVLVFGGAVEPTLAQAFRLGDWVKAGHGVLVAQTGWGWQQVHGGAPMFMHPFSRMLAEAGVWWTASVTEDDKPDRYIARNAPPELLHAGRALDALVEQHEKRRTMDAAQVEQARSSVEEAAKVLPGEDQILRPRLERLLEEQKERLIPSEDHPILPSKEPLLRVLVAFELQTMMQTPTRASHAHPAALIFPGGVPDSAPRVEKEIDVDTSIPGWHSTGLYAAPGEPVRYEVVHKADAPITGRPSLPSPDAIRLRFGCHRDALWAASEWKRLPDIAYSFKMESDAGSYVTPFGGLLYIDVGPEARPCGLIRFRLSGAVEAPLFVLGETSVSDWQKRIRRLPGPWGEIASDKVVISVPSCILHKLDDPVPVLKVWDEVMDAAADLAGRPRQRERPERYVADVQISAGYMHAGYPIMTHLDAATTMIDVDQMRAGQWGLFHELGHNHQSDAWTFTGTREVTCNLFTLYILETVCHQPPHPTSSEHPAFKDRDRRVAAYMARGGPGVGEESAGEKSRFEEWKRDPFLALFMYCELRETFGWEPFKRVFREMRELPASEVPTNDADKRDEWMMRMSRATGRNLGPFFERWGVPTSSRARKAVADLPEWAGAETEEK